MYDLICFKIDTFIPQGLIRKPQDG